MKIKNSIFKKGISLIIALSLLTTLAAITSISASAQQMLFADYSEDRLSAEIAAAEYFAAEEIVYEENGGVTFKAPTKTKKQFQAGFFTDSETVAAAIEAANNDGSGLLEIAVTLNKCVHGAKDENCSAEIEINVHDDTYTLSNEALSCLVRVKKYVGVGKTETLYLDVSDVDAESVHLVRLVAMNWANTNPDTGAAAGIRDIDVTFSPITVTGVEQSSEETSESQGPEETTAEETTAEETTIEETTAEETTAEETTIEETTAEEETGTDSETKEVGDPTDEEETVDETEEETEEENDDVNTGTVAPLAAMILAAAAAVVIAKSKK